nr:alcohol dehydrogenase catalytic domain-containing protein [Nocardioides luti]
MKAFVLHEGRGRFEERPLPKAGPTDVIVRATAVSACSAELACLSGEFPAAEGTVLGHEGVGVVHEVGSLVTEFEVGQRVTTASTTPCGICANCQRGFSGHCRQAVWGGYTFGVSRDGTFAEYFTVPQAGYNVVSIPDKVSDAAALCITDTIASGSTGVEAAQPPLGSVIVVFGQGHIGLGATATARAVGAALVITVKSRPGGEHIAKALGADFSFNLADHDVQAEIRDLTGGLGADVVIEATGARASFPMAVEATREGGVLAVLSAYDGPADAALEIPLAHWGWGIGDKTILSTFQRCGSERMGRLLRLVETGRIDPTPLLTRTYGFGDLPRALADLKARPTGHIKPLITFEPASFQDEFETTQGVEL